MNVICGDPADPMIAPALRQLAAALRLTTPELQLWRGRDGGLRRVDAAGREAPVAALAGAG